MNRPAYLKIEPTQRWTLVDGVWCRQWIVRRLSDGALRFGYYRDAAAVAA